MKQIKYNLRKCVDALLKGEGFSVSLNNISKPIKGYMVAANGSRTASLTLTRNKQQLEALLIGFVESNIDELTKDNMYLGGWVEDGFIHLDVSELIDDYHVAIVNGGMRGQKAIFDLHSGNDLYI